MSAEIQPGTGHLVRQPEVLPTRERRSWRETATGMTFRTERVAQEAFAVIFLQTLRTQATGMVSHLLTEPLPVVFMPTDMQVYRQIDRQNEQIIEGCMTELAASYQEQQQRGATGTGEAFEERPLTYRLDSAVVGQLEETRDHIYSEVSDLTGVSLTDYARGFARDLKQLRKSPQQRAIINGLITPIPKAMGEVEVETELTNERREIAETAFAVTLVRDLLKDIHPHPILHRRNKEEVRLELLDMLLAYQILENGNPNGINVDPHYIERVSKLQEGLAEKKQRIYAYVGELEPEDIEDFRQTSKHNVEMFMTRKLRGGEKDLMTELTDIEPKAALDAYMKALGINAATGVTFEVTASAIGLTLVKAGLFKDVPVGDYRFLVPGAYTEFAASIGTSAYFAWKLLERTGLSPNIGAKAGLEMVAPHTDNKILRYLATLGGYGFKDGVLEVLWAAGLLGTYALTKVTPEQLLGFVTATTGTYGVLEGGTAAATWLYDRRSKRTARNQRLEQESQLIDPDDT